MKGEAALVVSPKLVDPAGTTTLLSNVLLAVDPEELQGQHEGDDEQADVSEGEVHRSSLG